MGISRRHNHERYWPIGRAALPLHCEKRRDVCLKKGGTCNRLGRQLDLDAVVAEALAKATSNQNKYRVWQRRDAAPLVLAEGLRARLHHIALRHLNRAAGVWARARGGVGEQVARATNVRRKARRRLVERSNLLFFASLIIEISSGL